MSPQIRAICEGGPGTPFELMFSVGEPSFHCMEKREQKSGICLEAVIFKKKIFLIFLYGLYGPFTPRTSAALNAILRARLLKFYSYCYSYRPCCERALKE